MHVDSAPADLPKNTAVVPWFRRRFSVRQLMWQTAIASLFFAALLHENKWWRATLFTVTLQ